MTISRLSTRHRAFNSREPSFCLANQNAGPQVPDISSRALSALLGRFVLRESHLFVLNSSASIKPKLLRFFFTLPKSLSLCSSKVHSDLPSFLSPLSPSLKPFHHLVTFLLALNLLEPFFDSWASSFSISTCSNGPYCSPSKAREPHLLNLTTWQFGLVQMAPPLLLSTNHLSSWKVDVSQNQDVAEVPSQPWKRMTFPLMRLRRNCNAIDEDGRARYDDSNLAVFIQLSALVASMAGVMTLTMAGVTALTVASMTAAYHGQSDGRLPWLE
ncbi:hypothetical protein Pyn_35189 [Prunus yedoensis var. nudiflora]|uniref:Uncharacterized protein n=1 Tax=Prunus yedoensis var. nudiflora TaxID=2094558 RepID=A0A314Y294_PRUYE|nr:hypothetical protein Pyn_35189 [Prunus yedoensis var. nudiflora]